MSLCGVFKGWVFLLFLQTHTGCCIPTTTLPSNPAEHWAWVQGRESRSLDLTRAFILIMFPFILFFFLSFFFFFCRVLFYPQSYIWLGQFMPSSIAELHFSLSYYHYYYYFFFTAGLARVREGRESFQLCPRLNLLCAPAPPTGVVGWCTAVFDIGRGCLPWWKAASGPAQWGCPRKAFPPGSLDDVPWLTEME